MHSRRLATPGGFDGYGEFSGKDWFGTAIVDRGVVLTSHLAGESEGVSIELGQPTVTVENLRLLRGWWPFELLSKHVEQERVVGRIDRRLDCRHVPRQRVETQSAHDALHDAFEGKVSGRERAGRENRGLVLEGPCAPRRIREAHLNPIRLRFIRQPSSDRYVQVHRSDVLAGYKREQALAGRLRFAL